MQRFLGIAVVVMLAGGLHAQDMPLSQIIKDGEGWKELAAGLASKLNSAGCRGLNASL